MTFTFFLSIADLDTYFKIAPYLEKYGYKWASLDSPTDHVPAILNKFLIRDKEAGIHLNPIKKELLVGPKGELYCAKCPVVAVLNKHEYDFLPL